jgi:hypothetical protein
MTDGIRHRVGKFRVEIRVAKEKSLGFDKISLGSYCTREQAYVARLVGDRYCRKWPPGDCSISDLPELPFLCRLDPELPPDEMKKKIKEIARRTARTVPLRTHPGRGLINAAAAAPVQQRVENEGGFSHFEPDRAQRAAAAAAAGVNNPSSNFDQIGSHRLDPDTTQQDDSPNTQELQHLRQQRSSHGTAAAGDLQYSHVLRPQPPAVEPLPVDQHSGDFWDIGAALKRNEEEEGQVPRTDWVSSPYLVWLEDNVENPQSDMELDQQVREYNLPILSDSTIPHNHVSTIAHHNIQESEVEYTLFKNHMLEAAQTRYGSSHGLLLKIDWGHEHVQENQGDEMEVEQYWEQDCDEMQF